MKKRNSKKGFTLIELLTVVVILGVLVLIAIPKFTGYINEAKIVQIKSDIRSMETKVASKLLEDSDLTENWDGKTLEEMKDNKLNGSLYSRKGIVKDDFKSTSFKRVPNVSDFLKTSLKGEFIYGEDGEVYYHDSSSKNTNTPGSGSGSKENENTPSTPTTPEKKTGFEWQSGVGYYLDSKGEKGHYKYVGNEEKVVIPNIINGDAITSYYKMFEGNETVKEVVSTNNNITDMSGMFLENRSLSLTLNMDTSNVTKMTNMFYDSSATELNLNDFDTSSVTNMFGMFALGRASNVDLTDFDTSSVTNMSGMFGMYNIKGEPMDLDLSGFITGNVTNMDGMFSYSKFTTLDIGSFETSSVTSMYNMFAGTYAESLDLSTFNVENVLNVSRMFYENGVKEIDISNWTFNTNVKKNEMFSEYKGTIIGTY